MMRRVWIVLLAGFWLAHLVMFHMPISRRPSRGLSGQSDKPIHFFAYTMLAWLAAKAILPRTVEHGAGRRWLSLAAVLVLYAGLDEWTQPLTNRDCDVYDWLVDLVGIAAGLSIAAWQGSRAVRHSDAAG